MQPATIPETVMEVGFLVADFDLGVPGGAKGEVEFGRVVGSHEFPSFAWFQRRESVD
jgi:hypothetical protein